MFRVAAVAPMQRQLVERARQGDHDAFADLARASHVRMYGIARLILRDSDRAHDAVQEALVQAWRHLKALRDIDAWDAWLYRTTVRACYRIGKKERRRRLHEVDAPSDAAISIVADTSADLADRDQLERELDNLDLDRRAVIVLHFYLDLPLTEVARILDIPTGTAKSRLHRGLETMRASMLAGPATVRETDLEGSA